MPRNDLYPHILAEGHTSSDGAVLALPLSEEQAAAMGAARDLPLAAPLFVAGEATSTFDLGWSLVKCLVDAPKTPGLPPWSAAIARSQTGGRGQLRREWHSPAGNLYVSFFLPQEIAHLESMASLCLGYLVHASLSDMGIDTLLKWPNDLLLTPPAAGSEGKFGGLLLEEREGRLLAGLGLNLCRAPEPALLRGGHAVPAAALPLFSGTVCGFWAELQNGLIRHYEQDIARATPESIRRRVETVLAWRGQTVYAEDPGKAGRMAGISEEGFLRLETEDGYLLIDSGSIRRV